MKKLILLILLLSLSLQAQENDLLKTVLEARSCTVNVLGSHVCRFQIGDDLDFEITGIGDPDVTLTIFKANLIEDAEYYFKMSGEHGCIIIVRMVIEGVFIHPRTAEVYEDYPNCWPDGVAQ